MTRSRHYALVAALTGLFVGLLAMSAYRDRQRDTAELRGELETFLAALLGGLVA